MITPKELASLFARNAATAKELTKGLTHADSVLQPPVQGNCVNWVLGHIADDRNLMLQLLKQPPILTEAQAKRYGYGSEPVCGDGEGVIKLRTLLTLIAKAQKGIDAALGSVTAEDLAQPHESFLGTTTLGFFVVFHYYHESYHLGQLELLRELALAEKKK